VELGGRRKKGDGRKKEAKKATGGCFLPAAVCHAPAKQLKSSKDRSHLRNEHKKRRRVAIKPNDTDNADSRRREETKREKGMAKKKFIGTKEFA